MNSMGTSSEDAMWKIPVGDTHVLAEETCLGPALSDGETVAVGNNNLAAREGVFDVENIRQVVAYTYYINLESGFVERCKTLLYNKFAFVAPKDDVDWLAAILHGGGGHLEIAYVRAGHKKTFVGLG